MEQVITNIDATNYTSSLLLSSQCNSKGSLLYEKSSRRRNKRIKTGNNDQTGGGGGGGVSIRRRRRRYSTKKPDPLAPKITAPCAICGRKFWSWKALFGHMRCHPERQWRGINPPPPPSPNHIITALEDHDVASSLLLLADCPTDLSGAITKPVMCERGVVGTSSCSRFECWSCKKVFISHQALGHKNTRNHDVQYDHVVEVSDGYAGHECSICFKVFSSGQALGGHKRCHWENGDQESLNLIAFTTAEKEVCGLDLNLPDPMAMDDDNSSNSSFSSPVTLDLTLAL